MSVGFSSFYACSNVYETLAFLLIFQGYIIIVVGIESHGVVVWMWSIRI